MTEFVSLFTSFVNVRVNNGTRPPRLILQHEVDLRNRHFGASGLSTSSTFTESRRNER